MTTREVLLEAAVLVEKGWTQNVYVVRLRHEADRYCATAAVMEASSGGPLDPAWAAISLAGGEDLRDGLTSWNDRLERTQADVVAVLRKAAEVAA